VPATVYPEVDRFDPVAVELDVLARWEREGTFQQSLDAREGAPHFVFYEGPPTANGRPGIHHVMARTVKDLFCRYKTMQGFRVDRKAGWDTHGLPVEIEVEKELGLKGRDAVEAYGLARFNEACRASVLRYKDLWDGLTVRMGYWVDLDAPYVTYETDYVESVWNLLQRIHERRDAEGQSLLARGHRIQWYSPANGTVLSSHEVSLGYKEVQDTSATVRFPVEGEPGTSLLAWTTTPWTLPANAALAVNPRVVYAKVRLPTEGGVEHVWIAEALVSRLKTSGETVERRTGADLVGVVYVPPYHFAGAPTELYGLAEALAHGGVGHDGAGHTWRVVAADYVTTEDGTGIVHTAPAFGADDWATGAKEGLPTLNPINPDGTFKDGFPLVGGLDFKAADRPILRDLKDRGLLYREDSYVHNYPHDWRRGTPLMQYPVESWFARTTAVRDRMVELNGQVNWQPEGIGAGRFGQWLENNVDWALSRMRFWGTPLPIWVSDRDKDHYEVVGSVAELKEKAGGAFPPEALHPETGEVDLHRPYVDAITWPDGQGGTMRRVPDLLDVWFDSGAMPWAQWHAPFENADRFRANVPADFIAEGVDQTRGWFYTLHAIAALVDDRLAYKNVVVNGLVLDADGQKMSKSVGNTVDPFETLERHGADAVRWTMMSASPPWENLKYSDAAVEDTKRKLFGTVVNTYKFFATYAALDGFAYDAATALPTAARSELDRWVLSRLQSTVSETTAAFEGYHPTRAARAVEAFVDDLSNWYLRRSRRRFWSKGDAGDPGSGPGAGSASGSGADKRAAYETLYECLVAVATLMAPIAPFTAEWLFGLLTGGDRSVHLERFPAPDASRLDADLEGRMALARAVVTATLALRNEAGLNVRQPLASVTVVTGPGGVDEAALRSVEAVVLDEVNVKRLETASGGVVSKTAKPNFKALGKRLGPQMKAVNAAVRDLDSAAVEAYEASGRLVLDVDGGPVELVAGDLDVVSEGVAGRPVRQETAQMPDGTARTVTVALDTALDDDLRMEGVAREFVNRVQNLRKEAGFAVSDRIALTFQAPPATAAALLRHARAIQAETLAPVFGPSDVPTGDAMATVDLGDGPVTLAVRRSPAADRALAT
jgi:isoleucyl-tRNA synthetase